jgi:hypothetical protein
VYVVEQLAQTAGILRCRVGTRNGWHCLKRVPDACGRHT